MNIPKGMEEVRVRTSQTIFSKMGEGGTVNDVGDQLLEGQGCIAGQQRLICL
jgi:hypothetical protein